MKPLQLCTIVVIALNIFFSFDAGAAECTSCISFAQAVAATPSGGTLSLDPGNYSAVGVYTKAPPGITIVAPSGGVVLGSTGTACVTITDPDGTLCGSPDPTSCEYKICQSGSCVPQCRSWCTCRGYCATESVRCYYFRIRCGFDCRVSGPFIANDLNEALYCAGLPMGGCTWDDVTSCVADYQPGSTVCSTRFDPQEACSPGVCQP